MIVRRRRVPGKQARPEFTILTTLSVLVQRDRRPTGHATRDPGLLILIPAGNERMRHCLLRIARTWAARGRRVTVRRVSNASAGLRQPAEMSSACGLD